MSPMKKWLLEVDPTGMKEVAFLYFLLAICVIWYISFKYLLASPLAYLGVAGFVILTFYILAKN